MIGALGSCCLFLLLPIFIIILFHGMSDGQLDGADRPTRARRADRLTDEERRLQAARWQAMAEKMAGEEEGEEEGNEEVRFMP